MPAVVSWQDKIYVISGTDNKWDDQSTVFVYHPRDDTWETKAQMPEARYINGVAVVKEKIIVLTGKRSDTKISKIFEYDPETDQWHYLGELPLNFMLAGVTAANDKLYVLGGSTHEHILSTCWQTNFSFTSNRLKGPYFRLKPPGMTPEIFAPGFISTKEYEEQRCIFSPDGTECYFVRRGEYPKTRIMVTRVQQEGWSKPKPVSFSSESSESMQVLTPDGSRMFFNSNRPLPGTTKENRRGIWFVERTHEGWGQPQYFGYGSQVTVAKNGTLYYRDPNNF